MVVACSLVSGAAVLRSYGRRSSSSGARCSTMVGRPGRMSDRVLALEAIHQRRVAVEVVEVLEQAVAVDLGQVGVGLGHRDARRDLDRHLLEADRRLERRLVGGVQPVDQRLLVLLDPPDLAERELQVAVHPRADVLEAQRLGLDPVHQDHADAGEGVVVELAVGRLDELAPVELLPLERRAPVLEKVERHGGPFPAAGRIPSGAAMQHGGHLASRGECGCARRVARGRRAFLPGEGAVLHDGLAARC